MLANIFRVVIASVVLSVMNTDGAIRSYSNVVFGFITIELFNASTWGASSRISPFLGGSTLLICMPLALLCVPSMSSSRYLIILNSLLLFFSFSVSTTTRGLLCLMLRDDWFSWIWAPLVKSRFLEFCRRLLFNLLLMNLGSGDIFGEMTLSSNFSSTISDSFLAKLWQETSSFFKRAGCSSEPPEWPSSMNISSSLTERNLLFLSIGWMYLLRPFSAVSNMRTSFFRGIGW